MSHDGSILQRRTTLLGLQRCSKRVFLYKNATCIYFIKNVNSLFVLFENRQIGGGLDHGYEFGGYPR